MAYHLTLPIAAGTRVRCIRDNNSSDMLKVDETYDVLAADFDLVTEHVYLVLAEPVGGGWDWDRFVLEVTR